MSNSTEVLIVGAGPTGLMMACELLRHRVSCRLIDKAPAASTRSKALVVQVRTLEIFQQLGIIEQALAHGQKMHHVRMLADNHTKVHLELRKLDSPYPHPLILEQSETERILNEHLEALGGKVERCLELSSFTQNKEKVTAILKHANGLEETLNCNWLIGCDGAHSTVRHQLGIPFTGIEYDEVFILADLKVDWPYPQDELRAYVSKKGFIGFMPMQGDKHYRLVSLRKGYQAQDNDPTLEEFQQIVNELVPVATHLSNPNWISVFRVHCRGVPRYQQGRAFLAGDAAHIHSPAGGQGMNTGIQDAYNLAWKLALVTKGKARHSLVNTYHEERHPIGEMLLNSTDKMFRVMIESGFWVRLLRRYVVPHVIKLAAVQKRASRMVSQLGIQYRHSSIVAEDIKSGQKQNLHAGDRAPDAPLQLLDQQTTLFEQLFGNKHTLLLFQGLNSDFNQTAFNTIHQLINNTYAELIQLRLIGLKEISTDIPLLIDRQRIAHHKYQAFLPSLYLIRPDGYIAYIGQPINAVKFQQYLKKIFNS